MNEQCPCHCHTVADQAERCGWYGCIKSCPDYNPDLYDQAAARLAKDMENQKDLAEN